MFKLNPMMLGDFYKMSHPDLYDRESGTIYATWTPRKSRIEGCNKVVVFGVQAFIQKWLIEYFEENFFKQDVDKIVNNYLRLMNNTIHSNGIGEKRIRDLHKLGYLPLEIRCLPEGTMCPIGVPMLTIENTKPEFYWITNFIESFMSSELWSGMTSATIAHKYKEILNHWAVKTCDDIKHVDFQGHDFSFRGLNTVNASLATSAGHLLSFVGTDTVPAIPWLEYYYGANVEKELVATSIPATEHSIMEFNSAGKENDEYDAFKRIITDVHPKGIVSVVSDTWNLWEVINNVLPKLKTEILSRDGKVVIRPDSGDPCDIVCGLNTKTYFDPYRSIDKSVKLLTTEDNKYAEQINKGVVELLWDIFGGTVNSKGYKVLNPCIGVIYGDAITTDRAEEICERLAKKGFASSNIVFGIGSYTYQYNTRDTFGFALKSTYAIKDGKEVFLFKDPITDSGEKKSQKGMVAVIPDGDTIKLVDHLTSKDRDELADKDLLQLVFKDGTPYNPTTLSEIRDRLLNQTNQKKLVSTP